MKTTITIVALCLVSFLQTGCASLVAAHLNKRLPDFSAEEIKVAVNIVGVGGGSVEASGLTNKDGVVKAAQFSEQINTGSGSLRIEGKNVELHRSEK